LEVKEACKQTLQSKVRNNVDMEKQ
jgi:hypothetical protein